MDAEEKTVVIIMAGGNGKRMASDTPKVLHCIRGLPMILYPILAAKQLAGIHKILVVVGKHREIIERTVNKYVDAHGIEYITQTEPLGTGHAVSACVPWFDKCGVAISNVLILSGDVPLLTSATMDKMLGGVGETWLARILATEHASPTGYGRVIMMDGAFVKIVEEKDATDAERQTTLINGGVYVFKYATLRRYLPMIQNRNAQDEFYLTDLVGLVQSHAVDVMVLGPMERRQIMGVNTPDELLLVSSLSRRTTN